MADTGPTGFGQLDEPVFHIHPDFADIEDVENPRTLIEGPHDIDGYTGVGWLLMRKDPDSAMTLVREGMDHNPEAFQLHYLLAQIFLNKARAQAGVDLAYPDPKAMEYLAHARENYTHAAELGLSQMIAADPGSWTTYLDVDLRATARMAVLMEKRYGNPAKAIVRAHRFHQALGGDPVLERYLE